MNFSEIRGQHHVARAIEIALTGNHNLLITGGAGMGKSMLISSISEMTKEMRELAFKPALCDNRSAQAHDLTASYTPVIMTTRPCPCGNYLSDEFECTCTPEMILGHMGQFDEHSIDMFLRLTPLFVEQIIDRRPSESSELIMERVEKASKRVGDVDPSIDADCTALLKSAHAQLQLPVGMIFRILNVARTIAAMAGESRINPAHLAEAVQYRKRS